MQDLRNLSPWCLELVTLLKAPYFHSPGDVWDLHWGNSHRELRLCNDQNSQPVTVENQESVVTSLHTVTRD